MTGAPDHAPRPDERWAGGPVEDTTGMRPILPDAGLRGPAEDTPGWSPAPVEPTAVQPASTPAPPATSGTAGASVAGFFSSVRRAGRWEVPPVLTVTQGFSDAVLDLREAVVRSGTVELRIYGGFSETRVIVPPGVGVDMEGGVAIFADQKVRVGEVDPSAYRVRIVNYGVFSSLRVVSMAVGEEPKKWWKGLT